MTKRFIEEEKDVFRLKIPFETVHTSVFLLKSVKGYILVDSGSCDDDIDKFVLPALKELDLSVSDVNYIIITHNHGDHAGGKRRLLELNTQMEVIKNNGDLNDVEIYPMAGHTEDFIGVLHLPSGTLISGDGLQGDGLDKFRRSIANEKAYLSTIERIEKDNRIKNVLFSHCFEPCFKYGVKGRDEVNEWLKICKTKRDKK